MRLRSAIAACIGLIVGLSTARAVTIVATTGHADNCGSTGGTSGNMANGYVLQLTWTQSTEYTNVSIAAALETFNASYTSFAAYLTTQAGPGTTTARQIAAATVTGPYVTSQSANLTQLFSGLTLPPGTYYLTIYGDVNEPPGLPQCVAYSLTPTTTTDSGVTNVTNAQTKGVAPYPPATSFSRGGPGYLFSVTGNAASVPIISKGFAPPSITPGGVSTLTFQISNQNSFPLTGVGFTDPFPGGLVIASPSNLTSTCNGTLAANAGGTSVTLTNGSISANSSCTISLTVTAANEGPYDNTTGKITSTQTGTGAGTTASATLTVAQPPTLTKVFSALAIPVGDSATLTFTLTNPNQTTALGNNIAFTDTLPGGLIVSTPNGLSTTCSSSVPISAPAGSTTITANGVALSAPGGSCTITLSVTAIASGVQLNTTSPITSVQTVAGAPATATITTGDVFEVNYAANLNAGDAQIDITNTGVNGAALNGPGIGAPAGNICVNVYAFAPDEQLISCCSCLVTPDGLASLSVNSDIVANTATGARPTSVVIKLIATLAGTGGSGASCTNSAAAPGPLTPGLQAWRTSLHAAPSGGYTPTETPFTQSTLSASELASVANRCTLIIGNNSGAGICNACRTGGLGAARQQ